MHLMSNHEIMQLCRYENFSLNILVENILLQKFRK